MKRKLGIISWIVILSMVFVLEGCTNKEEGDVKKITIGVMGANEIFNYDASFLNGIELAVKDFNKDYKELGYEVEYQFYDDKTLYEDGMIITTKLIQDPKVTAILGSQNLFLLSTMAELINESGKIMVAPHGIYDSVMEEDYDTIFRNTAGAKDFGKALAEYAQAKGIERVAVLNSKTEYEQTISKSFIKALKDTDVQVLDCISSGADSFDWENISKRWETLDIQAVLITQYLETDSFALADLIRKRNPNIIILGDFAFDFQEMLEAYQKTTQGIIIPQLVSVELSQEVQEFYERYKRVYNEDPTWWAAHGYDSVRMITDTAVRIKSTDPKLIAAELKQYKDYKGLTGPINFDKRGCLVGKKVQLLISKDAKFTEIESLE